MAWRLADYLERAEISSRSKGIVTGRLWFKGLENPIELHLAGAPWRDIAGYRIAISTHGPKEAPQDLFKGFATKQVGVVGDITASRKVRVPDIPMEEFIASYKTGRQCTFHQANCLYLEWYSQTNGRVVIETVDFDLTLEGESTWTMSEQEEIIQRTRNEGAIVNFMNQLVATQQESEAEEFDLHEEENTPTSAIEAEEEEHHARMNLLMDRVQVRLRREGLDENAYDRIYEEERERLRKERGEPEPTPLTPLEEAERERWIQEMNDIAEAAMEEWPPNVLFAGNTLVRLKKAQEYLRDALAGLNAADEERLAETEWRHQTRLEIQGIQATIGQLIQELREHLENSPPFS